MTDTSPEIAELVRQKLMARSAEERFLMGVGMFDAARANGAGLAARRAVAGRIETPAFPTALWSAAAILKPRRNESSVRSEIFVATKPDKFLSSVRSDIENE